MLRVGFADMNSPMDGVDIYGCASARSWLNCPTRNAHVMAAEVLTLFAQIHNLSLQFIRAEKGQWGDLVQGQWDGLMRDLIQNNTDLTIPYMGMTAERASAITFSYPFMLVHHILIFHKQDAISHFLSLNWITIFRPETLLVLAVVLGISHFLPRFWFLACFMCFLEQIMNVYVDSVVTSRLSIERRDVPFDKIGEIADGILLEGFRSATTDNTSAMFQYVQNVKAEPFLSILSALKRYPTVPPSRESRKLVQVRNELDLTGWLRDSQHIRVAAKDFSFGLVACGLPKGSKLTHSISSFFMALQESGLQKYFMKKYDVGVDEFVAEMVLDQNPISLEHLKGHFLIWIGALCLAILAFILEMRTSAWRHKSCGVNKESA